MPRIPAALAALAIVAVCIGFNTGRYPVVGEMAADVLDSWKSSSTATQTAEISPSPVQPSVRAGRDQAVISDTGGSVLKAAGRNLLPTVRKASRSATKRRPPPQPKPEATGELSPQSTGPAGESEPSKPALPPSESLSEPSISKRKARLSGTTCSISSGPVETPDANMGCRRQRGNRLSEKCRTKFKTPSHTGTNKLRLRATRPSETRRTRARAPSHAGTNQPRLRATRPSETRRTRARTPSHAGTNQLSQRATRPPETRRIRARASSQAGTNRPSQRATRPPETHG